MVHPDPAATVVAIRPAHDGFEVLMVERNSRGFFGNFVVFPGGRVDDIDVPPGRSAADDESHRRAAVRELAEEAGLLSTPDGVLAAPGVKGREFYDWLSRTDAKIDIDGMVLVSRWVTPEMAPRRFDTRFYLLACDSTPAVRIDADELIGHAWATPEAALARHAGGWPMILPTIAHLRWLAKRSSIEEAISSAQGADGRTLIEPRRVEDGSLLPIHLPADT